MSISPLIVFSEAILLMSSDTSIITSFAESVLVRLTKTKTKALLITK